MQAVIPMAGRSSRFFKIGCKIPKYMIKINNKTLFEYSIESLPNNIITNYIFVALREHEDNYNVIDFIKNKMLKYKRDFEIVLIEEVTRGQAETVLKAKDLIDREKDIIIYNIDTYFRSEKLEKILESKEEKKDGVIGGFKISSEDNKWSFAECDAYNNVVRTAEKEVISNIALTGLYHFTIASDFIDIAEENIKENRTHRGEFYIAPMYNDLINRGKKFVIDIADKIVPLGTPEEVGVAVNEL